MPSPGRGRETVGVAMGATPVTRVLTCKAFLAPKHLAEQRPSPDSRPSATPSTPPSRTVYMWCSETVTAPPKISHICSKRSSRAEAARGDRGASTRAQGVVVARTSSE